MAMSRTRQHQPGGVYECVNGERRLLMAREVAALLAVPESWVREATRDGRLPHLTLGRYRRYQRQTVEAWLLEQQAGPAVSAANRPDLPTPPKKSL
jgi:excisionase family DNA binding protein